LVIPLIYWLKTQSLATKALKSAKGELIVAAWMQPRAIYWVLRYHGIDGQLLMQPDETKGVKKSRERRINCLNLADFASAEEASHALVSAWSVRRQSMVTTKIERIEPVADARWYPVIDRSKCCNCKQCLDFCLFGVYELEKGERVKVSNPDSCKPGCPACARVCPEGAIIFPEYEADIRISGGVETEPIRKADKEDSEPSDGDELDELIDELDKLDE